MKRIGPVLMLMLLAAPALVQAQAWPSRPVRWIIPFPPGGASDIVSRMVANDLGVKWGQPVVIDNRPGAGGTIATADLVRSAGDHTIMTGTAGTHGIAPNLYRNLSFNIERDLTPVVMMVRVPMVLVSSPALASPKMADLVKVLQANPGKYAFASPGSGTLNHLMAEMFVVAAKASGMTHVPYKGSVAAYPDLASGRTQIMFDQLAGVLPFIRKGSLVPIATSHASAQLPDTPTMAAAGFPGFDLALWVGVFASSSMPPAVVGKISSDVAEVLKAPEMVRRLDEMSSEVTAMPNKAFAPFFRSELVRWQQAIRNAKVVIE
ncbi:MAG: tripartite tricarboxylate transporter substrate binding protein [Burkholderiales bacterium]|nr:tripartite tricarboxylate transporter substrate binding protein [Burkholderiales bacterium]